VKVLLVSANTATAPYPIFPLGMAMVARALRQAGHAVAFLDWLQCGQDPVALREAVRRERPDLIGVSIRNLDSTNMVREQRYAGVAREVVRAARAASAAPIVLGGSGFSILPERLLQETGADYGIVGEGERLAVELAAALERGQPPSGRLLRGPPTLTGVAIPSADYDPALLSYYLAKGGSMAAVQTKRGCGHRCLYCSYPLLEGRALRPRDPVEVVRDMAHLIQECGARYVFFTDSVFNDPEGHYRAIVAEMLRRNLHIPWTAFFRPAGLDRAILADMKRTGLSAVEVGADAPSDATLRGIGKDFQFADVLACHEMLLAEDIPAAHYFMFGCPGETPETTAEGIANIRALRRTVCFIFMGVRIFPGTPLETLATREGLIRPGQDLLDPVYYVSPQVDRDWLCRTLTEAFAGDKLRLFPTDEQEEKIAMLHELGYAGPAWDLLLRERPARRRATVDRE
jgi:lipid biosynthesis B12-binding/radical SAM protein